MRRATLIIAAVLGGALLGGCSSHHSPTGLAPNPRTYYMGFSSFAPRPDLNLALMKPALSAWDAVFVRPRR